MYINITQTENNKSTHMRTQSIPTLIKMKKNDTDNLDFQNSQRNKKIEIDENRIIEKLDGSPF